MLWCMLH